MPQMTPMPAKVWTSSALGPIRSTTSRPGSDPGNEGGELRTQGPGKVG